MRVEGPIPMLKVKDFGKTLAFYRDDLGMKVLNLMEDKGRPFWACLGTKARDQVMLYTQMAGLKGRENNHTIYYLKPDDVKALHARLKRRGRKVSDLGVTVYGMREFCLKDPDGRQLTFGQPTDDPPDCKKE